MDSLFRSWLNQFINYIPLALAITILSLAMLILIAIYTEPPEILRSSIENELKNLTAALTSASLVEKVSIIFARNSLINLLFAIPFFISIAAYASTMITTAWALSISALNLEIITGIPRQITIVSLMLMPHAYLELYSYSLSIIASLKLTLGFLRKRIDRNLLYSFTLTILASNIILLIAATIESILVSL